MRVGATSAHLRRSYAPPSPHGPWRPKPNIRVMKGNSVKMTNILHQKAFEMHALEASRVTDTSLVLAAFVCSIRRIIGQNEHTTASFPCPERSMSGKNVGIIGQNAMLSLFLTIF